MNFHNMITASSIQTVKDRMDVVEVVSQFVKLDRNQKGLCPFHAEKSPSFQVSPKRQTFKCFGCGQGGDAIHFLMEHEKIDFIGAIEWLASHYQITLEHEQETDVSKQKREQVKDATKGMLESISLALKIYQQKLNAADKTTEPWVYMLNQRQYSEEVILSWGLGYAPNDWQCITHSIINANLYEPAAAIGLVKTKEGKTYDFYRNRIIIPIHDVHGRTIGLAGRWLPTGNSEEDKKQAKYINPQESLVYHKSKTLFGLYQALIAKAFAKDKNGVVPPAFFVEGYFDVISLHEAGIRNTVSGCGTAITVDQVRVMKKYTTHFVVFTDGDSAGKSAAMKFIDICLTENVRVDVIELPEGQDPDSYIKSFIQSPASAVEEPAEA